MCFIIESEITGLQNMNKDMVGDDMFPMRISDKAYWIDYFMDCRETSRELATLIVNGMEDEVHSLLDSGEISYYITTDEYKTHLILKVYNNTGDDSILEEYYLPLIDGVIHDGMGKLVLAAITTNYEDSIWL